MADGDKMLSFNMLPPASASSFKKHSNSSNSGQTAANAPEPSSDDSKRIVLGVYPEKSSVYLETRGLKAPTFTAPLFNQQNQSEYDRSKAQEALGKYAYQEAIKAYKEKASEIRETAKNIDAQVNSNDKAAKKNLLQIMHENNQGIHRNLLTYRRTAAHYLHNSQFPSSPPPDDPERKNGSQVALYNQAITAYIM